MQPGDPRVTPGWFKTNRLFVADLVLVALSVVLSFVLRLNPEQFFLDYLPPLFWMLAVALLVKPFIYRRFGLYQRVWAYASIEEMKLIVRSVSAAALIVAAIIYPLYYLRVFQPFALSLPIFDWLLSLALVGGLRFGLRLLAEQRSTLQRMAGAGLRRALVVGAGDAGALVVREMQKNPQAGIAPIGLLDDQREKHGQHIHGVPVLGALSDLESLAREHGVDEVVMAIPSASGTVLRQAAEASHRAGLPFRTMPGIYELIGGKVSVNRLREVDITDLLRRQPSQIDREGVGKSLRGKRVLVTGAGGSIASELCRQVARWQPAQLVLLGHGENSIFEILIELAGDFPQLHLTPIIADVRDAQRMHTIFADHKPDVVFHTAAHKHVPLMEVNVGEAVANNVGGTRNVVNAALEARVPRLVMISTDKAVRPSSIMGATKRVAEWIVLDAATRARKAYSVVRFGNVLGSRGSVVPLFKRQIAAGGPLTVTHPEMERYFMTIPEAVHLVLQAAAFDEQGRVFMLEMGEPVRILDLANDLIRLSGLTPGEDIHIEFSGLRPGEKLKEQLWENGAGYEDTAHPHIHRVLEAERLSGEALTGAVQKLGAAAEAGDSKTIIATLQSLLPGSEVGSVPAPDFRSIS
ncbi:MAG: polysaccharide biosynthesis protein [Anaerolineales bacterium]|nr:polysaccharide biosynthesis protein [Anaerolineales bacterium]